MSEIIIAFLSGATVAGLSSYLAHLYSVNRDRRKEFNEAAKEFTFNFIPELKLLKRHTQGDDSTAEHILVDAIERHETAMMNFLPHLNRVDKKGFNEAWQNYALDDWNGWQISPNEAIHKYYSYEITLVESKMRELAIKSIEWLLTFAKLR